MLLRNLHVAEGLCNGTRLMVRSLGDRVIEAIVATGPNAGQTVSCTSQRYYQQLGYVLRHSIQIISQVLLPRIKIEVTDPYEPVKFCRIQFPVRLAFAMTINKSQGQTFDRF